MSIRCSTQSECQSYADFKTNYENNDSKVLGYPLNLVYGRNHVPRLRVKGNDSNATISYEFYCNPNVNGNCNISNHTTIAANRKQSLDDVYWYEVETHAAIDGNITASAQKSAVGFVTPTINSFTSINYNYDGTKGYPYKTTMEIDTQDWLLYHPFSQTATKNYFEIEFNKETTAWSGESNSTGSIDSNASIKTNRRIMW